MHCNNYYYPSSHSSRERGKREWIIMALMAGRALLEHDIYTHDAMTMMHIRFISSCLQRLQRLQRAPATHQWRRVAQAPRQGKWTPTTSSSHHQKHTTERPARQHSHTHQRSHHHQMHHSWCNIVWLWLWTGYSQVYPSRSQILQGHRPKTTTR
jgi:hypothetical protein